MSDAAEPREVFLLDMVTLSGDGRRLHGTLSLIDRVPRSTWTTQKGVEPNETRDTAMSEEQFRRLWDKISEMPALSQFVATRPDEELSFTDHYVVGLVFKIEGRQGRRIFLIPHDCKSEEVVGWIREIEAHCPGD